MSSSPAIWTPSSGGSRLGCPAAPVPRASILNKGLCTAKEAQSGMATKCPYSCGGPYSDHPHREVPSDQILEGGSCNVSKTVGANQVGAVSRLLAVCPARPA